jgi:hypothetical protein
MVSQRNGRYGDQEATPMATPAITRTPEETPIDQIGNHELTPTLVALRKQGGVTADADWIRSDPEHAAYVIQCIRSKRCPEAPAQSAYPIPSSYHGPYWDERAKGPYWTYPEGWPEASGTPTVLDCDPDYFRGLDFSHVDALVARYRTGPDGRIILPKHMTALAVIPKLESVAKLVRKPKKSWQPVNIAMQYLLGVLNEVYGDGGFHDYTGGRIGPEYHRLAEATAKALAMDARRTPGDVHVLPVQTGVLFAGYSVRAARGHLSAMQKHYGLHGFAGGILMLPHADRPERFTEGALIMDCPGTERSPGAGGAFGRAPYWRWDGGERRFDSYWVDCPCQSAGSGSFVALPA